MTGGFITITVTLSEWDEMFGIRNVVPERVSKALDEAILLNKPIYFAVEPYYEVFNQDAVTAVKNFIILNAGPGIFVGSVLEGEIDGVHMEYISGGMTFFIPDPDGQIFAYTFIGSSPPAEKGWLISKHQF